MRRREIPEVTVTSNLTPSNTSQDLYKLQKFAAPHLDGDPQKYKTWWEYFRSAVHENETLEDRHRIIQLISSAKGEAKEFLRGYEATAENYSKALAAVQARFGDETKLAQCYLMDLNELPNLGEKATLIKSKPSSWVYVLPVLMTKT